MSSVIYRGGASSILSHNGTHLVCNYKLYKRTKTSVHAFTALFASCTYRNISSISKNSHRLIFLRSPFQKHNVMHHQGHRRRTSTTPMAMVNVDVSPSVILGVGLIGAGVSLWQIRQVKPWISKDYDVVVSCISLLVGGILIFQGWRLDPLLLFGQLMTTGAAVSFAIEALRLRTEVYEQEEKAALQDVFRKKATGGRGAGSGYGNDDALRLPPPPPPGVANAFPNRDNNRKYSRPPPPQQQQQSPVGPPPPSSYYYDDGGDDSSMQYYSYTDDNENAQWNNDGYGNDTASYYGSYYEQAEYYDPPVAADENDGDGYGASIDGPVEFEFPDRRENRSDPYGTGEDWD